MKNPEDMMAAVSASMQERTGRTLAEWVALVQASGLDPLEQKAVRKWLGEEHGVLMNSQWAIADAAAQAAGWERPGTEAYIDQQYAGDKAALRPIFERACELMMGLGDDVEMAGRASYVAFVRARQFAAIAAATKSRVDVGLRYRDAPASELLAPAKGPGQATHKLALMAVEQVTDEVARLFRVAYEQNG